MQKNIYKLGLILGLFISYLSYSDKATPPDTSEFAAMLKDYIKKDSIVKTFKFDSTGEIMLKGEFAKIKIPKGFKFLNAKQSIEVLSDLWGNPRNENILGMVFPDTSDLLSSTCWGFSITFDDMGYVKDDDAEDLDADELLKEMKKDMEEANIERSKLGYEKVDFIGWAEKPYYDKDKKILYWSKELNFEGDSTNTLNYNVRILGRKGVLVLNAIGSMTQFKQIKPHVTTINEAFKFESGHRYEDYDSGMDKVAVYGIGGLVAGKVLAKVGVFAFLGKFIKLIIVGILGLIGAFFKLFKRNKE